MSIIYLFRSNYPKTRSYFCLAIVDVSYSQKNKIQNQLDHDTDEYIIVDDIIIAYLDTATIKALYERYFCLIVIHQNAKSCSCLFITRKLSGRSLVRIRIKISCVNSYTFLYDDYLYFSHTFLVSDTIWAPSLYVQDSSKP